MRFDLLCNYMLASTTDSCAKRCSTAWPRDLSKSDKASSPVLTPLGKSSARNSSSMQVAVNPDESKKEDISTEVLISPSRHLNQPNEVFISEALDFPS